MKKITALLVDDEIGAINTLRGMLNQYLPEVNVLDHAHSVKEALEKVEKLRPDVVFLDVEMTPFGSGFDFLDKSGHRGFGVIFVTAYPKYAIQAINSVQPWAYLVKPYSVTELEKAVQVAIHKIAELNKQAETPLKLQSLIVPDARKGNIVIRVVDILYCRADGAATDLFYLKEKSVVREIASRTLKDIEEQLPFSFFFRTHHSYLVNFGHIVRYERTGRNGVAFLTNGIEVPVSVSKIDDFEKKFEEYIQPS